MDQNILDEYLIDQLPDEYDHLPEYVEESEE
jgi:hypothetical protein